MVENWNSANSFIFYGEGGEISTNRRDEQELAVLSLHLLQNSLVYINTLMLQRVLMEPSWMAGMATDDLRGLTPLFTTNVQITACTERSHWTWLNAWRSIRRRPA